MADALDRISRLRAELAGLRQRLEELERPRGLHSGKPPSSDGPAQPAAERRTRS